MNQSFNIGIAHGGSMGDNVNLSVISAAVKRQFLNSYITALVPKYPEVYRDSKTIDRVMTCDIKTFQQFINKQIPKFDLFLEWRYIGKWYFSEKALQSPPILKFKEQWRKRFKKYQYCFDRFLSDIPAHEKFNKKWWELALDSSNLIGNIEDQFLSIRLDDYKASEKYAGLKYVTFSNGAAGGIQTKSWYYPYWKEIANYLRKIGFIPVQVGTKEEFPIEGTERFIGSIFETAALIKNAQFHIGVENGIGHVCQTTGTKAIVLFSSTPVKYFGYPNNINIRSKICSPCFWRHENWFHKCIREKNKLVSIDWTPPCMQSLFPKDVKKAIKQILKEKGYNMKYLEPNENMDEASLKNSLWHKEQDILRKTEGTKQFLYESEAIKLPLDETKGYESPIQLKRVHAMLNAIGTGKKVLLLADGQGYISNLVRMQGNEVVMTDISEIQVLRAKFLRKLEAYQCNVDNLPFKDKSFDVVVAAEVLEHVESMGKVMMECERVCKDSGQIIWTLPIDPSHDAYPYHFWSIRQNNIENNMVVMNLKKILPHIKQFK